jgi:hypothetical protein
VLDTYGATLRDLADAIDARYRTRQERQLSRM